jgi:hypothetical protein
MFFFKDIYNLQQKLEAPSEERLVLLTEVVVYSLMEKWHLVIYDWT